MRDSVEVDNCVKCQVDSDWAGWMDGWMGYGPLEDRGELMAPEIGDIPERHLGERLRAGREERGGEGEVGG